MGLFDSLGRFDGAVVVGDESSRGWHEHMWDTMVSVVTQAHETDENEPGNHQELYDEVNEFLNMPYWQRVLACCVCFIAGALMIILSTLLLPLLAVRPEKFALTFTLGNIICLVGICFLVGPRAQFNAMSHPVRSTAAIVYVSSLVFTLFSALIPHSRISKFILVLLSISIEILSRKYTCRSTNTNDSFFSLFLLKL